MTSRALQASGGRAPSGERAATTVGVATTVIGVGLTWAPDAVAEALGLRRPEPVRLIGLADLALVPGLVAGRPRWPWMAARAALNVAIAAHLVADARRTADARPRRVALLLAGITVADCATARRLWAGERLPTRRRT